MSARVAIVVGAGGELGCATAEKLAAAGFTVVGIDRSEDGLKKFPDGIRYEAGDATDRPSPRALSTGSPPRSVRPRRWSTPSARTTWATPSPRRPRTCSS
jgi:NAD(P)-dependent dehydrogenase (short-subunit alcohol dehydrogenase family)